MTAQLLFYKDITPLNRELHRKLKFTPQECCEFAASSNIVPLAGVEFFAAAHHYPIAFVGEGEMMTPVVLLGLGDDRNDFIDGEHRWSKHSYVPAFIRRYPFVLAREEDERFTLCFDAASPGLDEEKGEALFDAAGENSPFLDEAIAFLQEFSRALAHTREFASKLQSLGLLISRSVQLKHPNGSLFELKNFRMVDEEKFRHLPAKQIRELHQSGFLPWINAHLMSLTHLNDLFDIYLQRQAGNPARQESVADVEE